MRTSKLMWKSWGQKDNTGNLVRKPSNDQVAIISNERRLRQNNFYKFCYKEG